MDLLRALTATCLLLVSGLAVGALIAYMRLYHADGSEVFVSGPWQTNPAAGSAEASRTVRTRTALHIPLSLSSNEAEYFYARTDTAGQLLTSACTYRISGTPLEARWWSLTVYDPRGQLFAQNTAHSYSRNHFSQLGQSDFAVTLASAEHLASEAHLDSPAEEAVIQLPRDNTDFNLLLRIYNPKGSYLNEEAASSLPAIEADCTLSQGEQGGSEQSAGQNGGTVQ